MAHVTWRQDAAPRIRKVLTENAGKSEKEIRKALREAYPYGQRGNHPYKIWCDEIQRQMETRKSKNNAGPQLALF